MNTETSKFKNWISKDIIKGLYWQYNMSMFEIGEALNISQLEVYHLMQEYNIQIRPTSRR